MAERLDVLVVDDNAVFREALELVLGLEQDLRVVGCVEDGQAALDACRAKAPDVVLLDYRLPGADGVETTRTLREACPGTVVVALTAAADAPEVEALLAAGASACLTKDRDLSEIVGAVRAAARGGGAG